MIVKQAIGVGFGIGVELDELAVVEEGVGEDVTSGVEEMVEELCKTELEDNTSEAVDDEVLEEVALDETWAVVTGEVLVC